MIFRFISFGMIILGRVRDLMVKSIWKFTHKDFGALKLGEHVVFNHSKGFYLFFSITIRSIRGLSSHIVL